jgi:excisionase family DNA binding protein
MVPPATRSPDNFTKPTNERSSDVDHAHHGLAERREAMEKVLMTVDEAARQLAVSRWTMYRLIKERCVVSVQVGRCRRVTAESLLQYVAALVDGAA